MLSNRSSGRLSPVSVDDILDLSNMLRVFFVALAVNPGAAEALLRARQNGDASYDVRSVVLLDQPRQEFADFVVEL